MEMVVNVECHWPGKDFKREMVKIEAASCDAAGALAQLEMREKHPGCLPLVKGIRPADAEWAADPKPVPIPETSAPVAQTADKEPEGTRDYDRPIRRPFAEWNAMQWFSLRKHAFLHGSQKRAAQPSSKKEALLWLQEADLVAP